MSVFFWFGKPNNLPDDFHKPFLLSAVRIWAFFQGVFGAVGWGILIFQHQASGVMTGVLMLILSIWAGHREDQWAEVLKEIL